MQGVLAFNDGIFRYFPDSHFPEAFDNPLDVSKMPNCLQESEDC